MRFVSRSLLFLLMCTVLLLGAYLALHLRMAFDVREQPLLSLNQRQQAHLAAIDKPIVLSAYIDRNPRLVRALEDNLLAVRAYLPALQLKIIDPNTDPVAVKNHDITRVGQLYVQVGDKGQRLEFASPEGIVRTILELQGAQTRQIVHLQGSGERTAFADVGGSWRALYAALSSPQISVLSIDLKKQINLPHNADLSIVAAPDMRNAAHLNAALDTYLREGGNLLFTLDTQQPYLPDILQKISGVRVLSGVVVDMAGQSIGLSDPRAIPAAANEQNPITASLTQLPIVAGSVAFALAQAPAEGWQREILLQSSPQSWNETSPITGHIEHNAEQDEQAGPLALALLLLREINGKNQSVVLLGDSDLFTESALHYGGNLEFAQALIAQLANTSGSEALERKALSDQFITLTAQQEMLWASALLLFPILFLALMFYFRRQFVREHRLFTVDESAQTSAQESQI